jgi:spore coat protein H
MARIRPVGRDFITVVMLLGCGDGGGDGGSDESEALFDPDRVIEVAITMAPRDWDRLRRQATDEEEVLSGDCLAQPFPDVYSYFSGSVTIGGETVEEVGIRKKGFLGSLDDVRPSLKIKLDEYVEGQELSGLTRLTLNNAIQDDSFLHQCISYDLFAAAGVPAPRCSFARLTVNGDDLGLYVHVESIDKRFLARHFDSDQGNLYEGTFSDFRPGWMGTFEKKTNEEDSDRSDLQAIMVAADAPDAELEAALARVIDLDGFLSMWAVEVLLHHWDGYAGSGNNFWLYRDPSSGLFTFLPWGTDSTFENDGLGADSPQSVYAGGILARRLFLGPTRRRYIDRLDQLLATVWDEQAILAEMDRMQALITPILEDAGMPVRLAAASADDARRMVRRRRAAILDERAAMPADWTPAPLEPPCL